MPEHRVRVVVSHLGGGFGGKCDFHFEGHVAALARAARRPVRLVLSRREEFIAPDKVTHAMVVDLETGVTEDGTILARKARILLDSGAYAADTPVLGQIAAMMIAGPYRIPDVDIEAISVYTNRTPSGSVRAPTGPQACWAVEQHHDVIAERVGLDPVEFRRRNLVDDGDEGPTRQRHEGRGALDTLEQAVARIGRASRSGRTRRSASRRAGGSARPDRRGRASGSNRTAAARIVTGAQENGTGAVMALPILAAEELGMQARGLRDHVPGHGQPARTTAAAPAARRRSTTAARSSRLPTRSGASCSTLAAEALEAAVDDLELATATPASSAARIGGSRSPSSRRRPTTARCSWAAARGCRPIARSTTRRPASAGSASSRSPRPRTSPTRPAFASTRRPGVVRILKVVAATDVGRVLNPIGAEGQMTGGVRDGARQRDPRGHGVRRRRQAAQRVAARLQAAHDGRRAGDRGGAAGASGLERRAEGLQGRRASRRSCPTAGAVANAIAAATGVRVRRLPMTPERVWRAVTTGDDGAAEINAPFGRSRRARPRAR